MSGVWWNHPSANSAQMWGTRGGGEGGRGGEVGPLRTFRAFADACGSMVRACGAICAARLKVVP